MSLDYEQCKKVYAEKLAADWRGAGRMESAFYAAIKYAYQTGLTDAGKQEPDFTTEGFLTVDPRILRYLTADEATA